MEELGYGYGYTGIYMRSGCSHLSQTRVCVCHLQAIVAALECLQIVGGVDHHSDRALPGFVGVAPSPVQRRRVLLGLVVHGRHEDGCPHELVLDNVTVPNLTMPNEEGPKTD